MKKFLMVTITILWMAFIFNMSNKPSIESTKISDSFIKKTIVSVYKIFNHNVSINEEQKIADTFSKPIRKLAHFTIFLILGILVYLTIKVINPNYVKIFILSLIICIIYACSDEFHQLFIFGRSCEIKDVLIDSLGSLLGIYLINLKNRRVL